MLAHGKQEILNTDQGICFSTDGKGRAIDNIFIERFWRSIKYEKIYLEPSDDGLELYGKIKWYMEFYNSQRPYQSLNYQKPRQVFTQAA